MENEEFYAFIVYNGRPQVADLTRTFVTFKRLRGAVCRRGLDKQVVFWEDVLRGRDRHTFSKLRENEYITDTAEIYMRNREFYAFNVLNGRPI